ncbi:hypothetical protein QIH07_27305, partial [Klebsiella pneumoniae]|nr:hypothetical protein [Klebsiella pneumoniae]
LIHRGLKELKYLRWCILQFFVCQVFFLIIGYTSYFISAGGLFNAVAKEVYRYDTRSSFQCNDKYWIIPELGREARYLM